LLPKAARLVDKRGFRNVYTRGRSGATDLVVVYVLPKREGLMRFGFTVGKKVGGAVVRNRVKRVLREAVRQMLPEMTGASDIVVVARSRAANASYADLSAALRRLLTRAGVIPAQKHKGHDSSVTVISD
jgi:ribonuclease P protein component